MSTTMIKHIIQGITTTLLACIIIAATTYLIGDFKRTANYTEKLNLIEEFLTKKLNSYDDRLRRLEDLIFHDGDKVND